MKNGGCLPGLRGKQVSIALIVLVCTRFIFWGLERAPFLIVFPVDDRVRRLIHPDYLHENPLETLFSGSSSDTPSVMESPPSLPTGEPDSISAKEWLRILGLPSNATKDFSVENSPSDKDILVGDLSSPEANSKKSAGLKNINRQQLKNPLSLLKNYLLQKLKSHQLLKRKDSTRPLYSGKRYKHWLSGMCACRLTQRLDFFCEKYRWQPDNCDMSTLRGRSRFFHSRHSSTHMSNKTLAFVGDSLGRKQFQSIMCLIIGGKDSPDVQDAGKEYGFIRAAGEVRPDGWAFRYPKMNTTVLYYWSASLCEIEPLNPGNPSTNFAMHLDRPAWFLRTNLYRFDVVVVMLLQ